MPHVKLFYNQSWKILITAHFREKMVKSSSSPSGMDRMNGGEVKEADKVAREDTEEKGRENSIW